ncbi:MAG: response regulator [Candidatus Pacebacteria bacterium]|nr:response regulator [Candidatus Paceibacterota bacterium]
MADTKKVVFIEDDSFLIDVIGEEIQKDHILYFNAKNGIDGLDTIRREKPDLVLLDLILPGISGFDVLKRIKQDPELSHIPVIVLSNLATKEDIEKAKELGAVDYMVKAQTMPDEVKSIIFKYLQV